MQNLKLLYSLFPQNSFLTVSLSSFMLKTLERLLSRFLREETLVWYPLQESQYAY